MKFFNPSAVWNGANQDNAFENALVQFTEEAPNQWRGIADQLPGISPDDVASQHAAGLLHGGVHRIESVGVNLPNSRTADQDSSDSGGKPAARSKRRQVKKWTEEEHRQFLQGLAIYGKSDWRSISRNCVTTRTPQQIASHAQKYYLRLGVKKEDRKRSSIHDIGLVPPQIPNAHDNIHIHDIQIPNTHDNIHIHDIQIPNTHYNISNHNIQIPNTHYNISNHDIQIPNTHYNIPNSDVQIPNTHDNIPNRDIQIPNTHYNIPSHDIQIPNTHDNIPFHDI